MSQKAVVVGAGLWCLRSLSQELSKVGSHIAIIHAGPTSCHCHSKVCFGVLLSDLFVGARKTGRVFSTCVHILIPPTAATCTSYGILGTGGLQQQSPPRH